MFAVPQNRRGSQRAGEGEFNWQPTLITSVVGQRKDPCYSTSTQLCLGISVGQFTGGAFGHAVSHTFCVFLNVFSEFA